MFLVETIPLEGFCGQWWACRCAYILGDKCDLANICFAAHIIDIFSLAITDKQILSTSGASSIKVHSTIDADFPLVQSIEGAHTIGCHHIVTNGDGSRAITAGFDGEIKAWSCQDGHWVADTKLTGKHSPSLDSPQGAMGLIRAQPTSQVPMPGPYLFLMMVSILLVSRRRGVLMYGIWLPMALGFETMRPKAALVLAST